MICQICKKKIDLKKLSKEMKSDEIIYDIEYNFKPTHLNCLMPLSKMKEVNWKNINLQITQIDRLSFWNMMNNASLKGKKKR